MNFFVYLLVLIAWAPSLGFSQMFGYVLPPGGQMGPIQIESTDSGFPQRFGVGVKVQIPATPTVIQERRPGFFDGIMNSFFGGGNGGSV